MVLENLFQQNPVYLQLARFFVFLFEGIFLTRLLVMPLTRKIMEKKGSGKKARHSIENILGALAVAATVAIGFGMRDQISSIVAGVFIFTDSLFIREDYIRVEEFEGVTREIKLRTTVLNGKNREKQVVPNNILTRMSSGTLKEAREQK